jgi:hypothetical protein
MSDWRLPWVGGCRCGATRVAIDRPPLLSAACHCAGCRRMSASAFSLTLSIPSEGFSVTQGAPVLGGLKGADRHSFCPACLSWMFTRPEGLDWIVNLRVPALDDPLWVAPFMEVWTRDAFPWARTGAARRFDTQPEEAEFAGLLEAFAREGARPT